MFACFIMYRYLFLLFCFPICNGSCKVIGLLRIAVQMLLKLAVDIMHSVANAIVLDICF